MTYFQPFVDGSGLHFPTYQDIEDKLIADAKRIFGDDIYLGNDSLDFQDIAARAQAIYDALLSAQLAYNSRSPITASGTSLDLLVSLNGMRRLQATFSTVSVTLTGTPFTVINNGLVSDVNGNQWVLPALINLDSAGTATVTATAQAEGNVSALADQVNIIQTPTFGWTAVNNEFAATPGRNLETDPELRARQAVSVSNPSQSVTTGILSGVLAVSNVIAAQIYENDTNAAMTVVNGVSNPGGYPPHSITVVVEGGDNGAIGGAIANRKPPGCYTNGDISVNVIDAYGVITPIRFYRPTPVEIDVTITVTALAGYTDAVKAAGRAAILAYINGLVGGQSVVRSSVEQAALTANPPQPLYPVFSMVSLQIALHGNTPGTADLNINFNQRAFTILADITWIVSI